MLELATESASETAEMEQALSSGRIVRATLGTAQGSRLEL